MILNIFLVIAKGAGGIMFHSQALLADAIHSLSDLATDLAVIFGVKYWSAPPDESHPYGHGKIETLITSFIGFALAGVAFGIAWDAVSSIRSETESRPALIAFIIAVISIFSKEILFRWTRVEARKIRSRALEANAWHHRSDAISSVPVAIAIALSHFVPELYFIDPLGAVVVAFFIFYAAWKIIKPALFELTEASSSRREDKIKELARQIHSIKEVHAIRTRRLGSVCHADMHVMVDPEMTVAAGHSAAHELKKKIMETDSDIADVLIHVEPFVAEDTLSTGKEN